MALGLFSQFGTLSNKVLFGVHLGIGGWFFFLGGLACILVGLLLIAPPPQPGDDDAGGASPPLTRIPSAYTRTAYTDAYTDAFLAASCDEMDPESVPIAREPSLSRGASNR